MNMHQDLHHYFDPWLGDADPNVRRFAEALLREADEAEAAGRLDEYVREMIAELKERREARLASERGAGAGRGL